MNKSEALEFANNIQATHIFENEYNELGWVFFKKCGSNNPIFTPEQKVYFMKLDNPAERIVFMASCFCAKSDLYYDNEHKQWFAEINYSNPDFSIIPKEAIKV
ncbi:hypothetical protein ACG9XS_08655 [Acinetobacter gyllenbergii]|uniref:hypothetical protein n=1 Tax=Acinetobacter gyllenbergii TaxID=134534 RepID=UPI0003BE4870|nr:hypothetical protein [Acinetobacter gyllenbergii]ESK42135.1 hypothetical protein F987_02156 [Acinetobacter gyllenbergii NIPH 230]